MRLRDFWRVVKAENRHNPPVRLFMRGGGYIEGLLVISSDEGKGFVGILPPGTDDTKREGKIVMPKYHVAIEAIDAMEMLTVDGKKETHDA
jgi:hypothetical protein